MEKLSLETLPQYDQGSLLVMFDQALRDAYLDLEDRPTLGAARKVTLSIALKPVADGSDLEEVHCEMQVACSLPHKAARTNILAPSKKHSGLVFEPDCRRAKFAPGQQTLEMEAGDE